MYTKLVGINNENITHKEIISFTHNYARVIFSGKSAANSFSRWLSVNEMDGLKLFLGVPDAWLTVNRQRFAEIIYADLFKLSFGSHPEIWIDEPKIVFPNLNYIEGLKIDEAVLDLDFVDSFGIRKSAWEKEVFFSDSIFTRVKRNTATVESMYKSYLSLAMFGFSNPEHFFVPR